MSSVAVTTQPASPRFIDRSAWLRFTSASKLSPRGRNDLLPEVFGIDEKARLVTPPPSPRKASSTHTTTTTLMAQSMSRKNNSWYTSEHAYEPKDKISPSATIASGEGRKEASSAARAKRLQRTDVYTLSQDPAVTSERHTFQVSGTDGIRRDAAALRFYCGMEVPAAAARLPCASITTSPWLQNTRRVPSPPRNTILGDVSVPSAPPALRGEADRQSGRGASTRSLELEVEPSVWRTRGYQ